MTDSTPRDDDPQDDALALHCGPFSIDRHRRRMRRQGQPVALGSRAFDLLLALIDGRRASQPAAALRAAVWPDRAVGDNNLRVQMTHLRRLLGEDAIVHRPGRGYQLMLTVRSPAEAPPLAPALGNLPQALWPLIGREAMRARLATLLQPGCRVTLQGPGGVGKTVLALAVSTKAAPTFADGAWWVDLAPLRDAAQLVAAVRAALNLAPSRQASLEGLASELAQRQRLLLLLDNGEHLAVAVNALSDLLLRAAPGMAVLCTSRVALRSAGEQLLPLPPLSLPAPQAASDLDAVRTSEAVAVFEARVRCVDPRFRLNADNAGTVLDICHRLDGHALAITLAAARLPLMGLQALRDSLDQRLRWTQQAAPGSAAPQHLSLQGTLDWTCALLSEAERQLLRRLGVFCGHFSRAAIECVAVAGDPPVPPQALDAALETLLQQGMVVVDGAGLLQAGGGPAVFTMHGSTRLFAQALLQAAGEVVAVRRALLRLLHKVLQRLADDDSPSARLQIQALLPDVQDLVERPPADLLADATALCAAATNAWRRGGQHALLRRLAAPLLGATADAAHAEAQVHLLLMLCLVDYECDAYDAVLAHVDQVLLRVDRQAQAPSHAMALSWRANVMAMRGELQTATGLYRQVLAIERHVGQPRRLADTLSNLGWALQAQQQYDEARRLLHEARSMSTQGGFDWTLMVVHENLAELELGVGDSAAAHPHIEALAVLAQRHPDLCRLCNARALGALVAAHDADLVRSGRCAGQALQLGHQLGSARLQAAACSALALALARAGDLGRARSLVTMARRLRALEAGMAGPLFAPADDEVWRGSEQRLSPADRQTADVRGALLRVDEARAWAVQAAEGQAAPVEPIR
jgi:predicted ATPase/DNA-binding winged helix-turn-helix (wHTH) protein/Tfp pilus assembly protein PilF